MKAKLLFALTSSALLVATLVGSPAFAVDKSASTTSTTSTDTQTMTEAQADASNSAASPDDAKMPADQLADASNNKNTDVANLDEQD